MTLPKVLKELGIAIAVLASAPILLVLLASISAKYRDVSHQPKWASKIGQTCTALQPLRAQGFYSPGGTRGVTDEVAVTPLPGFGGREVTFTEAIPTGTRFQITGVRECWNCPFGRIDYRISVPDIPKVNAYPTFAGDDVFAPEQAQCTKALSGQSSH